MVKKIEIKMKRILIFIPCIFFVSLSPVLSQDIYIYKHKNGNVVITNRIIPEEYKTKAQKVSSFHYVKSSEQSPRKKVQETPSTKTHYPQNVEKEKRRLEAEIKRLKNMALADDGKAQYYKYFVETYENQLQLLTRDPEGYFSKQEEFAKEAAKLLRRPAAPN